MIETLTGKTERRFRSTGEEVYLITEGAGLFGHKKVDENRNWAPLVNHVLLTARLGLFLAGELQRKGISIDKNLFLDSIFGDHSARPRYEQAKRFPDLIPEHKKITSEGPHAVTLAAQILKEGGVSPKVIDLIMKSDVEEYNPYKVAKTWEHKLWVYADLRADQKVVSLQDRFESIARRGRVPNEKNLKRLENWTYEVEEELFGIIGMNPTDITETFPFISLQEAYLRRLYFHDAEAAVFKQMRRRTLSMNNSWWGSLARKLYEAQKGQPYHSSRGKPIGIERAIDYYKLRERKYEIR